jgi:hypothetical protein
VIFSKSQKNAQINLQDTILCNFEIGSDASNLKLISGPKKLEVEWRYINSPQRREELQLR